MYCVDARVAREISEHHKDMQCETSRVVKLMEHINSEILESANKGLFGVTVHCCCWFEDEIQTAARQLASMGYNGNFNTEKKYFQIEW